MILALQVKGIEFKTFENMECLTKRGANSPHKMFVPTTVQCPPPFTLVLSYVFSILIYLLDIYLGTLYCVHVQSTCYRHV